MRKNILFAIIILFIVGCSSSKPGGSSSDMPSWFLMPPNSEGFIYGVGQANKQNPSLSKQAATARARTEISQSVNVKVASMLKDFMQQSGVGDDAMATEFTESVTKQVTNNSLKGSTVKEAYVAKDGTMYIMVEYSMNSLKQAAVSAAKKEEALYNEFKANQGFDELEKSINDL